MVCRSTRAAGRGLSNRLPVLFEPRPQLSVQPVVKRDCLPRDVEQPLVRQVADAITNVRLPLIVLG